MPHGHHLSFVGVVKTENARSKTKPKPLFPPPPPPAARNMEAVGSRLGRASSRYGAPAVFSGPVRKWKKKWVHVSSSLHNSSNSSNNSNSHSHSHSHSHKSSNNNNNSASSRLILRRWTPITAAEDDDDPRNVSEEPPRRKFRYTPIAVLEEQKKAVTEKVEYEPAAESAQLPAGKTNLTYEIHGKLNMNEVSEESKLLQDSNIGQLDLGLSYPGINGENSPNSDDQSEKKYLVGSP